MQLFDLGQNFIRPQLATVAGAAVPSPYGGKILQVQIDLDQEAMQAHSVSADDVLNAVSVQNLILPAGDAKVGKFDWNVALNASPVMLQRINDLPVKKANKTIIYVHDVAYVHEGSPPQTNLVRVNGSRAVLMTILKGGAASTLNVIDGIKSLLPRVEESLPSSLNLRAVGDQSIFVKAAVFGVLREAALAAPKPPQVTMDKCFGTTARRARVPPVPLSGRLPGQRWKYVPKGTSTTIKTKA